MKKPELTIVLLNWNGYDDTKHCLESIYTKTDVFFNVVLIDNGSIDNSVSKIRSLFPELKIIELPENIGYAAGNNVGLRFAVEQNSEAVLLLNNDTILSENCLYEMLKCLNENPQVGAVVPKIYYQHDPNLIWYAGGEICWWKLSVRHFGFRQKDNGQWDHPKSITFATGCALLLKPSAVSQIGYLDESFYSYFEDVDFSLRLVRAGFKIQFCPSALLWHKVGAGTKSETYSPYYLYYQTRNRIRGFCRHKSIFYVFYAWTVNFFYYFLIRSFYILIFSNKNKLNQLKAVFLGFWDSWKNKFGANKRWEAI